jgi:Peptidase A4 family/Bacterial Ig-like domain (group 3)
VNQKVQYVARVATPASAGPARGTVTFTDGGASIPNCTNRPLLNIFGAELAVCTETYASPGTHQVGATFRADVGLASSQATPVAERIVRPPTTTTISSSANPGHPGQSITYTAKVAPVAPYAGTETGTVSFSDDGATIPGCAAVPLTNGAATCSETYQQVLQHHITARYTGSAQASHGSLVENMTGELYTGTNGFWAGYMQSAAHYTGIEATFTVPTIDTMASCPSPIASFDPCHKAGVWLGIGDTQNLIQAGIQADLSNNGSTTYCAWTERLPASVYGQFACTSLAISPGQQLTVTISEVSTNQWLVTLRNRTTHKSVTVPLGYQSDHSTAEAIVERTNGGPNSGPALTPTNNVVFDRLRYATSPPSTSPVWQPFFVSPAGAIVNVLQMTSYLGADGSASASAVDGDGDGFQVADGTSVPAPPASS